jgi:glycosyltransferase involved in cell wall biosynthesis
MKKLKLLHITRPTVFGIYRFLMDLIFHTDREAFEIMVACPADGPLRPELKKRGVRVVPVEMMREIHYTADIKSFFALYNLIKQERPDVVHLHCSKAGFIGRIAAGLVGVPARIYTPNSWYFDEPLPEMKKRFYIFLERFAAYFGHRIVTVTNEEKQEVIKKRIASPDAVTTIYDGIDVRFLREEDPTALRKRFGIPGKNKVVGMIARLVPQKDPLCFVRLAHEVTKEHADVTFMLIGNGPLRGDVEDLKTELGLRNSLILAGECDINSELNSFLNLLDISVLTSLYEGLPLTALQSMYLKKPLVITKVRGIDEVIRHGANGFIVPIGDVASMKNIVTELLTDTSRAKQIGNEAHQTVTERFTAEQMAKRYEQLYRTVLTAKRH